MEHKQNYCYEVWYSKNLSAYQNYEFLYQDPYKIYKISREILDLAGKGKTANTGLSL